MTDDRGTVTAFVVGFMAAVLAAAGLVIDGGRVLAARRHAADVAESAARAGAQAVDEGVIRSTGEVHLDPDAAIDRAETYLTDSGISGSADVDDDVVTVEVEITTELFILGFAGLRDTKVTASGQARSARGITEEQP